MAKSATLVFAGTVREVNYRTSGGHVVTDVVFRDLKFAVGSGSGHSLTLTLAGGYSSRGHTSVVGMPEFATGKRYVILAINQGTEGTWFAPIIGLDQGCFPVLKDSLTGTMTVHEHGGMPLARIIGGHIAVVARSVNGSSINNTRRPEVVKVPGSRAGDGSAAEPGIEIYPRSLDPGTRVSETEFLQVISRMAHETQG